MGCRRPISFEPNSLYISTQALINGSFHWSFFITDSNSRVQRHHWAKGHSSPGEAYEVQSFYSSPFEDTSNSNTKTPNKFSSTSPPASAYSSHHLGPYVENSTFLAYFKVNGYVPPRNPELFSHICRNAFPYSYPSVKENRAHGLSCQSWILKVLSDLWSVGAIKDRTDDVPRIEEIILRSSQGFEGQYLQCFLRQEVYSSAIVAI